jgi:hypothetical protein
MDLREVTVPELAKRLGCSIPHAQALIRTGQIRGHKENHGWVTTTLEVEVYLDRRARQPKKKT